MKGVEMNRKRKGWPQFPYKLRVSYSFPTRFTLFHFQVTMDGL